MTPKDVTHLVNVSKLATRLLILFLLALVLSPLRGMAQVPELQRLAAVLGADQGVFVQAANGRVLVAQQESRAVHPASVSKVATTLALLEKLGPQHRFVTRFVAGGPLRKGRIDGDLFVESGGDPFFVFENAFLVLRHLHDRGLRVVQGDLRLRGEWMFNWQPDPQARRLKRALQGLDGLPAWLALGEPRSRLSSVGLRLHGEQTSLRSGETLAVHRSPPLRTIVKALNGYSNNVFHGMADHVGGAAAVETSMREHVAAALRSEITITNGAGAGESNRLSPRAAVAILWELERELSKHELRLVDALPVNGMDTGTLQDRLDTPPYRARVVGKTGTYGSVGASALAGVLRAPAYGEVAFAILNSWVPVPEARQRQDAFVRSLIEAVHATAWDYAPNQQPIFADARIE